MDVKNRGKKLDIAKKKIVASEQEPDVELEFPV